MHRSVCPVQYQSVFHNTKLYETPGEYANVTLMASNSRVISCYDNIQIQHSFLITGSAVALHCCKAHSEINRKMGNLTPCKIVTPKNFNLKLCTHDYVGEATHHANFGFNRYSRGVSPYRRNITTL